MPVRKDTLSPNQLGKRGHILGAARRILLAGGPAACTSRAVADESGLTKGLIHYYFETVDEIVDEAMRSLLAELFDRLRATAARHTEPPERFWAVVEDYVAVYAEEPQLTLLWFDYWVRAIRAGRRDEVEAVNDGLVALLTELLSDASVPDPAARARAVLAYVIGVLVRQEIHALAFSELRRRSRASARYRCRGRAMGRLQDKVAIITGAGGGLGDLPRSSSPPRARRSSVVGAARRPLARRSA